MNAYETRTANVLVDNRHLEAEMHEVRNPANATEIVGYAALGTQEHAELAVQSSVRAAEGWANLDVSERIKFIESAFPELQETLHDRARLLTREQGKALWESVADCNGPVLISKYFIGIASETLKDVHIKDDRGTVIHRHVPYGVATVIVPWNTPVYLSFQHIAPALMSGNTVIVKTPENTPLSLSWTLDILAKHLPDGVLNVVPGTGSEVGAYLSSHPDVRKVLFTGSLEVGRLILHAGAETIKSTSLELGGNDPAILLPDFNMSDELIREIVLGTFTLSGQICFNIKRIYVPNDLLSEFTQKFMEAVNLINVGSGLDSRSTIGPVNNANEYERLQRLLTDVRASGANVHELGQKVDPDSWEDGYFILPHVVTNIDESHQLVVDEQFGPIVPIIGYDDVDAVIEKVNESEYGLGASLWTDDTQRAFELGRRISAGTVFINVHRMGASDMTMPFGGTKRSGLGRTHGPDALLECTEPQVLVHRIDSQRFPSRSLADGLFD